MDRSSLDQNFPSNSDKSKLEKRKVEKIVKSTVRVKKQSPASKLRESFFGEDLREVAHYVISEVVVPKAKDMLSDAVSNGIDMILYGESRNDRNRRSSNQTFVSYNGYYGNNRQNRRDTTRTVRSTRLQDIIFDNRGDAEDTLNSLFDMIQEYGTASVADLYDLCGITGEFTDNDYGWNNLARASVRRVRDGYILDMPKTIALR